jgi:hypothetical protein
MRDIKVTADDLRNADTVKRLFDECRTTDEVTETLSQISLIEQPMVRPAVDLAVYGPGCISLLGDGTLLVWGAEKSIGQRTFTNILVDAGEGDEQTILSADTQGGFAQYERSWERLLDLYGSARPGEERTRLFEAMEELMADETPEDGDVTSAVHDLLAQRDLPRPDYEPAEVIEA